MSTCCSSTLRWTRCPPHNGLWQSPARRMPARTPTRCSPAAPDRARPPEDFPRRGARRGQDLGDAGRRACQRRTGVDVVAGLMRNPWPRGTRQKIGELAVLPRLAVPIAARCWRSSTSTPRWSATRNFCWSTSWPTPTPRAAPHQALAGCAGDAGSRHRCLDHAQRAASGKPERRGRAHHRRARGRDAARHACWTWPTRSS